MLEVYDAFQVLHIRKALGEVHQDEFLFEVAHHDSGEHTYEVGIADHQIPDPEHLVHRKRHLKLIKAII